MQLQEAISFIQNDYLPLKTLGQNLPKPSVWADLGCGSGLFTAALSHYMVPGSTIYAVDKIVQPSFKVNDASIRIISVRADFEKEKLSIGKLDGILMANSLHYVNNKLLFLQNCKKHYGNSVFLIVEYNTHISIPHWVPYPIDFPSLKRLFISIGFRRINMIAERPSVFGNRKMYAALVSQ